MTPEELTAATQKLTRELIDNGKLIEAGWVGMRAMAIPADAPPIQVSEMRNAFFAGAHHVFSSIMMTLGDNTPEADELDMAKLDKINGELENFIGEFTIRNVPTEGSA